MYVHKDFMCLWSSWCMLECVFQQVKNSTSSGLVISICPSLNTLSPLIYQGDGCLLLSSSPWGLFQDLPAIKELPVNNGSSWLPVGNQPPHWDSVKSTKITCWIEDWTIRNVERDFSFHIVPENFHLENPPKRTPAILQHCRFFLRIHQWSKSLMLWEKHKCLQLKITITLC